VEVLGFRPDFIEQRIQEKSGGGPELESSSWNHGPCPIALAVFMMAEAKPAKAALAKAAPAK